MPRYGLLPSSPVSPLTIAGVYGILIFEWVQTALITQGAFYIYVYRFGQPEALALVYNGWFALPVMCAMLSMVVQGFYAWRIYVLSKMHVIVGAIVTVSRLFSLMLPAKQRYALGSYP